MNEDIRKMLASALAAGTIVSAAAYGITKPNCDYVFVGEGKEICLTQEQKDFITENLKGKNTGFGQSQFNDIKIKSK